jgi:hypothetical protein
LTGLIKHTYETSSYISNLFLTCLKNLIVGYLTIKTKSEMNQQTTEPKNQHILTRSHKMRMAYLVMISLIVVLFTGTAFIVNNVASAKPLPPLDQASLKQVMALDKQNQHATFVFVNEVPGSAKMHNKVVMLPPISDKLRINFDEYVHKGHNGPLYIILPDKYAGPKEKFILKAFPDYKGWYASMLSDNFVMYAAK